jgi:hypothetical protein
MSDRKYRQRGYMDDDRSRSEPRPKGQPQAPREPVPREMRRPNMPGFRDVVRCTRCGSIVTTAIGLEARCGRCGVDLHACIQCASFDPGSRFQCMQAIPVRIAPKDTRNTCTLFEARTTVERETGSPRQGDARSAFDDLFK